MFNIISQFPSYQNKNLQIIPNFHHLYTRLETMTNQITNRLSLFIFLTILVTHYSIIPFPRFANAGKIHITDDLDDIIDDEEDDDWKNWGKKKPNPSHEFDLNPSDFDKMEPAQIQAEMMKHQTGPVFGFVKLRLGVQRTPVSHILYCFQCVQLGSRNYIRLSIN